MHLIIKFLALTVVLAVVLDITKQQDLALLVKVTLVVLDLLHQMVLVAVAVALAL